LPESPFDATADRPACSCLAGLDVFGKNWYVEYFTPAQAAPPFA
jgi:hypothetical protein